MNKIILAVIVMAIVTLTGCAGTSMKARPDGKYVSATTVRDGLDRSTTFLGVYEKTGDNKFELVEDFEPVTGPTVLGQTVVGVSTSVAGQATGGYLGIKQAEKLGCKGAGNCGTNVYNSLNSETSVEVRPVTTVITEVVVGNCGQPICG